MRIVLILVVSLFIFGCFDDKNAARYKPTPESTERERLADQILSKVAAKLHRDKGLLPCGFGGRTSEGVKMLALSFDYREPITMEDGRELLIASVQEFIAAVNAEEKIRPYLKNYPFDATNIELRIFLQNSDGTVKDSGIHVLAACGGILRYEVDNPDGPLSKTLLRETYEEALQKIEARKKGQSFDIAQVQPLPASSNSDVPSDAIVQLDPGVELIVLTEDMARKLGAMDLYRADPGFMKWLVLMHDIAGNPPYQFQQKRLWHKRPNIYNPCSDTPSERIVECKKHNYPARLVVSARGFLPGEKITIRLAGSGGHKDAVFYPRPLLLKGKSGNVLVKGTLISTAPGFTNYDLEICGVGEQEKYQFISCSAGENIASDLQGPMRVGISPDVVDVNGGVGNVTLRFENGSSYTLKLPWGRELRLYNLGDK